MRVLCTTLGSPSHGRAQLPLLRALAGAGHEVHVATTPGLAEVFQHDDVTVRTVLPELHPGTFMEAAPELVESMKDAGPEEQREVMMQVMSRALSGPMARFLHEALGPVVEELRPDLILRDGMDLSAVLFSEQRGIPQLPTPSGASNVMNPELLLPGLNALRTEFGLPEQEDPLSLAAHGRVDYVPPEFSFAEKLPGSLAYRQTVNVDRTAALPRWVADLPTDRPLVFAALGTALPMLHKRQEEEGEGAAQMPFPMPDPVETLRTVVGAAALLEECNVIVATGGLPVDGEGLPPHVHLTERLAQPLLLESTDLFLTHGGFNSIRESMRTATPLAVLPQFGDQPVNAKRVQDLGLGREVTETTPEGTAKAARELLADRDVAATARRARLAMLALPEIENAVPDLEKLAK
ncbi:glycosyltransferase [Streptomyces sp. ODS28]|uniref:glycosyltransferase n=1 Tax=Streptomyces sp. ODS28 TaxID=3136688 RepID=UPI0031EFC0D0